MSSEHKIPPQSHPCRCAAPLGDENGAQSRRRTPRGIKLAALMLGVSLAASGCGGISSGTGGSSSNIDEPVPDRQTKVEISQLVQGFNDMGFDLLRQANSVRPQANTLLSPASIAIALSMTMNGANGPTRDEMARTLGVGELSADEVNQGARALLDAVAQSDSDIRLAVANSIWARKGLPIENSFLAANKAYYDAQVETLDFASPKAPKTINQWVSKRTNDLIPEIVDRLDPQTIMVLLNAVYFKGDWSVPFSPNSTRPQPFTLDNGDVVERSMMARTGTFAFADRADYSAVRLPYGNGNFGLLALLPKEGMKLQTLVEQIDSAEWSALSRSLADQRGDLVLPRIQLTDGISLKEPLQQLGMKLAFDDARADFSKLLTPPPASYISAVEHKTFLRLDEKGTEAAAATKVEAALSSAPIAPGFKLVLDRPFLIAIHEQQTGMVLFVGAVYDPGAKGE